MVLGSKRQGGFPQAVYKVESYFADVFPQSRRLVMNRNMQSRELYDPENWA